MTPAPAFYAREVDAGTPNACWVMCSKGDPGAVAFSAPTVAKVTRPEPEREVWTQEDQDRADEEWFFDSEGRP